MTEEKSDDPLAQLIVDGRAIDKEAIVDVLKGRVGIDPDERRLVLLSDYGSMDSRRKVLAVLLAAKAAGLLGIEGFGPMSNARITEASGLPSGTAAPSIKSIRELRLVAQDSTKGYYIPDAQVAPAVEFLRKSAK